MKVKRFDLYEELWTKSRTAYCNEHDLEFENLKEIIKEHDIPLPPSNYLYHYRKGNILPKHPIQGDNYEIFLVHRKSEKDKLFEKWCYFDDEKKEELFAIYSNIKLPERVGRYHKLIVGHREYVKEQKRLDREAERHPFGRRNFNNKQQNVLNTHRISDKTLSDFYVLTDTLFKALESAGCTVSVYDKRIVIKLKSAKEVDTLNSKNGTPSKVFATDFTYLLHFRDKNNQIKNEGG
ncbi:hypothetical protein [Macrococcus bovicus]|uniref:Uncharacterized protein n=1 Tax=Macrococcus bovicus TaxID=69968 RepID=A0A4R6BZH4_9STAP|nr:hypothetical protein [Macrococcus bovicus]TDM13573.1 hypothetical protein ERX55_08240 [Macrococcus bovicus]